MSKSIIKAMQASFRETCARCLNPKHKQYHLYGGRGVTICQRWLDSFQNFLDDMGLRPPGMTLERRDNNKNYSPDNCIWASRKVQAGNRRINRYLTVNGVTHCIAEWERQLGFKPGTLKARVCRLGYTLEEALTKPVKCGGKLPGRKYKERKPQNCSNIKKGIASPLAAFSGAELAEMRHAHFTNKETFSSIAKRVGKSVTTVSNAVQKKGTYKND